MKTFIKGVIILTMLTICYSCNYLHDCTTANTIDTIDVFFESDLPGTNITHSRIENYGLLVNWETNVQYLRVVWNSNDYMTTLVDAEGKPILYGNTKLMPKVTDRFFPIKRIYRHPFYNQHYTYYLIVDSRTGVQYLLRSGLALYCDSEGKPILYEGPIPF